MNEQPAMRLVPLAVLTGLLCSAAPLASAQPVPLELRFASEAVPPGGVLQAKLEVTESRPILTGGGSFNFGGFDDFLGLAANSPSGDAAAVAVVRGSTARVAMTSPSGGIGLEPDYPILTVTMRVPAAVPPGTQVPLSLAGQALFLDPSGAPYPYSFRDGQATVAAGPAVSNVSPGSGVVPAGGVVTVDGVGFDTNTELRINEVVVSLMRLISSTRIEAVLAQPATMHGRRVEVRDKRSNARSTYFAYERTVPVGRSTHPLFGAAEPAFAQRFFTRAIVDFGASTAGGPQGLALQNIGTAAATISLELLSGGARLAQLTSALAPTTRVVRSLEELFGAPCPGRCAVRVSASSPVQILGLAGNIATDFIVPVLPAVEAPERLTAGLNAASFSAGQVLALTVSHEPGSLAGAADAYVVLQFPDGALFSLTSAGLVPGILPFARSTGPGAWMQEVLRVVVPPGVPVGAYAWYTALAEPGTLNLVTDIAVTPFSIVP